MIGPYAMRALLMAVLAGLAAGCGPASERAPSRGQTSGSGAEGSPARDGVDSADAHHDALPSPSAQALRKASKDGSAGAIAPGRAAIDALRDQARQRQIDRATASRLDLAASRHAYTVHRCMPLSDAHRYACLAAAAERRYAEEQAANDAHRVAAAESIGAH